MTEFEKLESVIRTLRAKDGCPWDRVQTHGTLKAPCIEEAAEVISGINILTETGNPENLREELGDLLMQVVFHAQIAEEEGLFTMDDVIRGISEKMRRRHPHIFRDRSMTEEEAKAAWDEIKKKEKEGREWEDEFLRAAFDESEELIERARKRKGFLKDDSI